MTEAPAVEVRTSGPLELTLLAALHAACFADGAGGAVWSAGDIAEVLSIPGSFARIATATPKEESPDRAAPAAQPVGLLLARVVGQDCEILSLGVAPPWRRRGVARRLLRALAAELPGLGARQVFLEVAEDNAAARGLYRAEGFARIGRRPDYYRRAGRPPAAALVFSRRVMP